MSLFAESLSGGQFIVLGVVLVVVAVMLRRGAVRGKQVRNRDPLREVHEDFRKAEASYSAQLGQMEIRLHDFAREVEGRIQTRLALLDRLIVDADREIIRLQELLPQARQTRSVSRNLALPGGDIIAPLAPTPNAPPTLAVSPPPSASDGLPSLDALADAGHTAEEIAARLALPLARVVLLLNLRRISGQADAA